MSIENINFFIATMIRNGHSTTDAANYLGDAWAEDEINISKRRVQQIAKEFKEGRTSIHRKKGSGRPISTKTDENIQVIQEIISENNCASLSTIENVSKVNRRSIQQTGSPLEILKFSVVTVNFKELKTFANV